MWAYSDRCGLVKFEYIDLFCHSTSNFQLSQKVNHFCIWLIKMHTSCLLPNKEVTSWVSTVRDKNTPVGVYFRKFPSNCRVLL